MLELPPLLLPSDELFEPPLPEGGGTPEPPTVHIEARCWSNCCCCAAAAAAASVLVAVAWALLLFAADARKTIRLASSVLESRAFGEDNNMHKITENELKIKTCATEKFHCFVQTKNNIQLRT